MKSTPDEPLLLEDEEKDPNRSDEPAANVGSRAVVPDRSSLWIALPRLPENPADLATLVAERVPLPTSDLAWTEPAINDDGAIGVSVARKAILDYLDNPSQAIDERTGLPFRYGSRSADRQSLLTIWVVVFALALAGWAIASKPQAPAATTRANTAASSAKLGASMVQTPVTPAIEFAGRVVRQGFTVSRLSADSQGILRLDIDASDPDTLRSATAKDVGLDGFEQVAQTRDRAGAYRVSFEGKPPASASELVAVAPLVAQSQFDAIEKIEKYLGRLTAQRAVRMTLSHSRPDAFRPLAFSLSLEGPEAAVLAVVQAIEMSTPPIALTDWSYVSASAGAEFSGSLAVPWHVAQ